MAQLVTNSSYSWSYAGTNKAEPVHKFVNPSKSEKCQINSITLYLGTINGKCTWGSTATGTGKPITTYASISGTKTNSKTVTNKVRTLSGAGGYYPDRAQINVAYTFTFSPAYIIPAGGSAILCIQTPTSNGSSNSSALAANMNGDRSNGHPITISYDIIPNIAPDPGTVTISCDDFAASWINWKVSTSRAATHYEIFVDGQSKGTFTANSGTVYVTATSNKTSGTHSLYAKAKNNNSAWITSNTIRTDCTIPTISNAGITVTGASSGNLYFNSNYDVKYYLENSYIGSTTKDVNVIKSVILANNTLKNYTLVVKRSDNTKITNSLVFKMVNTTVPTISLRGNVSGTNLNYTASANKNCKNWVYKIFNTQGTVVKEGLIESSSCLSVTGSISDLAANVNYTMQISANGADNGLAASSNIISFKPDATVKIWTEDSTGKNYRPYIPYVWEYDKSTGEYRWFIAVPYVYDENDWKICT